MVWNTGSGLLSEHPKGLLQLQPLNLLAYKDQEVGFNIRDSNGLGPGVAG